MKKSEMINAVAAKSGASKQEVEAVINAFGEVVMEVIANEDSVKFANVGTFSGYTKVTNDRTGRNPATGETITIKGKTQKGYPKFKPSKAAKE